MTPETFDKKPAPLQAILGGSPADNAALIQNVFAGITESEEDQARRDIVVINASAALVAAGVAEDFREGAAKAEKAIDTGLAAEKLQVLARFGRR